MDNTPPLISDTEITDAVDRLPAYVQSTPLFRSAGLSDLLGVDAWVKCEMFQPSGSFKVRGAMNRIASLSPDERDRGVIAFSAGNHAIAVAYAASQYGITPKICMPAQAVQFKVDAVRALGADLELVDGDLVGRVHALIDEHGYTLVHPFADREVIAATGTVGREITEALPDVTTIVVPLGGGGLISGIAAAVKTHNPDCRVIGVEPSGANVMSVSLQAGTAQTLLTAKSLADGLTAPLTTDLNLAHVRAFVDDVVVVPEDDIRAMWETTVRATRLAIEPSAAVGVGAVLAGLIETDPDDRICFIMCGANTNLLV